MERRRSALIDLPEFVEETVRVCLVKASVVDSVHAFFYTVDANLIGRRAHDRAMLLVSRAHSFVCLKVIPLPENPHRCKCRRRVRLRNGRERTEETRMNDPFADDITKDQEDEEVPHKRVPEYSHDAAMQKSRRNDWKRKGTTWMR